MSQIQDLRKLADLLSSSADGLERADSLAQAIKEREGLLASLDSQAQERAEALKLLKAVSEQISANAAQMQYELQAARESRYQALDAELSQARESTLKSVDEERERLSSQVAALTLSKSVLSSEVDSLTSRRDSLNAEIEATRARLSAL